MFFKRIFKELLWGKMMYFVVLIEESRNSCWKRDKNKVEKQNRRLKNMLDIPLSLIIINKSPMNSS